MRNFHPHKCWYITSDMLESVDDEAEKVYASEELYRFLQTYIKKMEFE